MGRRIDHTLKIQGSLENDISSFQGFRGLESAGAAQDAYTTADFIRREDVPSGLLTLPEVSNTPPFGVLDLTSGQ